MQRRLDDVRGDDVRGDDPRENDAQGRHPRRNGAAFEDALRADAARIRADVSPDADRRLRAALARHPQRLPVPAPRESLVRPWLAGSLVGLGVAAMVVLAVGRLEPSAPPHMPAAPVASIDVTPELFPGHIPLQAETAVLTAPLERELDNLQSDIEKARDNVERDLRLTF